MASFGEQLRSRREALGLAVKDAGRRLDVEPAQVRMWESGDRTPSPERQAVLLAALDVPVESGRGAEYQRGALWALSAMHETLARCYREMAQPLPTDRPLLLVDTDAPGAMLGEAAKLRDDDMTLNAAAPALRRPRRRRDA